MRSHFLDILTPLELLVVTFDGEQRIVNALGDIRLFGMVLDASPASF
jgi:hypothetical protein